MAWLALLLVAWPGAAQYADQINKYSRRYKFNPLLVSAVIYVESGFARSTCYRGAHGLMQIQLKPRSCSLTKAEAVRQGLYNPSVNIERGVQLMSWWRGWWRRHHQHKGYHWLLFYNQGFGKCPPGKTRCALKDRNPVTVGRAGGYAERVLEIYRGLRGRYLHEAGNVGCAVKMRAWDLGSSG